MKNIKFLSFLMIATSLLLVQCTTDPIPGPDGQDGVDGIDGTDGTDGASGTTECAACHNISTSEGVHASYLYSKHASGKAVRYSGYGQAGGGINDCATCHSNEGFIDYVISGASSAAGYDDFTAISCTTCHSEHKTFDFENDGYDFALRYLRPTTLFTDETYTINYEGTSNSCTYCHQARKSPPESVGGMSDVGGHYGPHHGPQANFLEGLTGAELVGSLDYPAVASGPHRNGSSCTQCHMGESDGDIDGNHTWITSSTSCATCHPGGAPDGAVGLKEDMAVLLALCVDAGVAEIEIDEEGNVSVHEVEGTYPTEVAYAFWNYLLVAEDASNGTHNPNYAKALVGNSIEVLTAD